MDLPDLTTQKTAPRTGWWIAPFSLAGIFIAFFGAQFAAALVLSLGTASLGWSESRISNWFESSTVAQFLFVLLAESLTVAAIFGLMKFLRWSKEHIGIIKPKLSHLMLGIVAVVPYYIAYAIIAAIASQLIPSLNVEQEQELGFAETKVPLLLVLTFLSLVVLPPLVEEIAMRGFLYSGIRAWLPKILAAILVSGAFALLHLNGGAEGAGLLWIAFIDTFVLSLILISLREITGNIWAGVVLHAIKNGIAFTILFIVGT